MKWNERFIANGSIFCQNGCLTYSGSSLCTEQEIHLKLSVCFQMCSLDTLCRFYIFALFIRHISSHGNLVTVARDTCMFSYPLMTTCHAMWLSGCVDHPVAEGVTDWSTHQPRVRVSLWGGSSAQSVMVALAQEERVWSGKHWRNSRQKDSNEMCWSVCRCAIYWPLLKPVLCKCQEFVRLAGATILHCLICQFEWLSVVIHQETSLPLWSIPELWQS